MKKHFLIRSESLVGIRHAYRYIFLLMFLCYLPTVNAQAKKHPGNEVICPAKNQDMHTKHGIPDNSPFFLRKKENKPVTAIFEVTFGPGAEANPAAKAAFQFALDIWATEIVSAVPIRVFADFATLGDGILASAGPTYQVSNFPGAPEPDVVYPAALANSLAGTIIFPEEPFDLRVNLGNGVPYYFGMDGNTPAGQFDFVTIALHEAGHGLGFTTRRGYDEDTGNGTLRQNGEPSVFGLFFIDGDGNRLLEFDDPSTALGDAIVGGDLFVDGPFATAALAGTLPEIYAPATFAGGSSLAHWDEATFPAGDPNSLMTPQAGRAESNFDIGAITRGHFKDMGWVLNDIDAPLLVASPKLLSVELNAEESLSKEFTISSIASETLSVEVSTESALISFPSITSFDLGSAKSLTLEIDINTTGVAKGFYQEEVLLIADGNENPVIIPIDIRILDGTELPSITVNPSAIEETLDQFQVVTKDIVITNSGDGDYSYTFTSSSDIDPVARFDQLVKRSQEFISVTGFEKVVSPENFDNTTALKSEGGTFEKIIAPLYVTSFEEFELGDVNEQLGWAGRFDNNWSISDVNPSEGTKHIRGVSDGLGSTRDRLPRLGSPVIIPDGSEPFTVFKGRINIQGSGVTWEVLTQAASLNRAGTRLRFNPDGSIDVRDSSSFVQVMATTPEGYFDLRIVVDRDTSEFLMFFDDKLVYSGQGSTSIIDQVVVLSNMEQTGSTFDLDNFEIINGDESVAIASVIPAIGTVAFNSSKTVKLKLDTRNLDAGIHETSVTIVNNEGTTPSITIPVKLNVTVPPTIVVTPEELVASVDVSIDNPASQTNMLTIANTGASPLTYEISGGAVSFNTSPPTNNSVTPIASLDMRNYGVGSTSNISEIKEDTAARGRLEIAKAQQTLEFATSFTDSIFYDRGSNLPDSYVGLGDGRPIASAVRFEAISDFTLSAVRNGFRTESAENPIVILEIYKGGTTPTDGTLLLTQTIEQTLPSGNVIVEQLDNSLLFTSGETFWIVHKYPEGINFPQGFDTEVTPRPNTYFLSLDGGTSYIELARFPSYVRALGGEVEPYIALEPQSGSVAPGEIKEVAVTFDAANLANGIYETPIVFASNDPLKPEIEIPTTFNVAGQVPAVEVTEDLVLFENVFIGNQKEKIIAITNTGLSTLELSNMSSNSEEFQISKDQVRVPAGATYNLFVNYVPTTVGSSNGIITIKSNDPEMETVEVIVNGNGVAPPVAVLPELVAISLDKNELGSVVIELRNDGESPLQYAFNDAPLAVPSTSLVFVSAITPISGVLAAGAIKTLTVDLNATGIEAGTYQNMLTMTSNAPDKSTSSVIFELEVLPIVEIARFDLINADTDEVIGTLVEGTIIDLADFDNNSFNIVAVPGGVKLGSVLFDFNGVSNFGIENVAPYALGKDIAGDFRSLALPFGTNTVTANSYTKINGTGEQGTGLTVNFEVIDSVTPAVINFALVNADTDTVIGPLSTGDIINTTEIGTTNLNVIAVTGVAETGIVAFDLNGVKNFRTERAAPFTLAGDLNGDFRAIQFPAGSNTLTARPGSPSVPRLFGAPFTVTFDIVTTLAPNTLEVTSIYPNSVETVANFVIENPKGGQIRMSMLDLLGNIIFQPSDFNFDSSTGKGRIDMSGLQIGTYVFIVSDSFGNSVQKLVSKK